MLHPPRPHYEQCLLPSAKPLYNYTKQVEHIFHVPFWIPVKKNKLNYEWIEPSAFYGQEFTADIKNNENSDCLVYYNSTHIQLTNCSDLYNSICVYDAVECFDNTTRIPRTLTTTALKLFKSAKNSSRLFLAIQNEKHLKPLGQYPFKCFVDFNVSSVRVLHNMDIFSYNNYTNISLYGFPVLNSITTNYWCEAFRNYDLKLISSNRIHFSPCKGINKYQFTIILDYKLQNAIAFFERKQRNFCVISAVIENDYKLTLKIVANNTINESFFQHRFTTVSSEVNDIFCFSFHDLQRESTNISRMAKVCIKLQSTTTITDQLINILNSTYPPSQSMTKLLELSEIYSSFSAIDVYLTALIFRKYSSCNINVSLATSIVHNVMEIDRRTLRESQQFYNATSMLLYRFDKILANAEMVNTTGYVQTHQGSIMSLVADLKNSNLSGVASYNYSTNMSVTVLSKTALISIEDLLANPNLHSAILLPDVIAENTLQVSDENTKLALTFYMKDSLFNVEDSNSIKEVSSIFGAAVKNYHGKLDNPIFVIYRSSRETNQSCAYWQLNKNATEVMNGYWIIRDVEALYNYTDFVVCKYYRLSHFALLIFEDIYSTMDSNLIEMLESFTIVNSVLSLIGALGIISTAVLFRTWRKNKGNLVLMNFVLAICLQVISLHVSNYVNNQESVGICAAVGAILHYSVLSEFCWMLVIAVLQYKRYVQVFASQPEHLMMKACVTGWIVPVLPVTALLIVQPQNYTKSLAGLCYPAQIALYLTIFIPVGVILLINIIIYVMIIFDICSTTKKCIKKELIFQWLIVVLLFFMLGVTWAFAYLGYFFKSAVLMSIFSITSSLQGFVIFLFFIVFNKKTRNMYVGWLNKYFKRNEVSSKTNTTDKF